MREKRDRVRVVGGATSVLGALTLHNVFINECTRNNINITIKQSEHPKQATWPIALFFILL